MSVLMHGNVGCIESEQVVFDIYELIARMMRKNNCKRFRIAWMERPEFRPLCMLK